MSRQVMPTKSYLSQSELPVTFGLGSESTVDEVVITWPGGREQRMTGIPVDQLTVVEEATPKGVGAGQKPGKNP